MREKFKSKSFIAALAVIILAVSLCVFFSGRDGGSHQSVVDEIAASQSSEEPETSVVSEPEAKRETKETQPSPEVKQETAAIKPNVGGQEIKPDAPLEEPPEDPVTPEKAAPSCTVRVTCKNLVGNDNLSEEKAALVPQDGMILDKTVSFSEGDSAFDALKSALLEENIHLDFSETSGSAYVKGINNLYEKDCGRLSGWIYMVNGEIASVGSSAYTLSDGDTIEFAYTCDMGRDLP